MAANVILDLQLLDLPTAYGLFLTDADLTGYVTLTGVETLTNKTLTSPVINTPTLIGGTINNTPIGGTTPAASAFTGVNVGGAGSSIVNINNITGTNPLEVHTANALGIVLYAHAEANFRGANIQFYRSHGVQATPTAVQTSDTMGYFSYGGWDGSVYYESVQVQGVATENWSGTNRGSLLQFLTTANGAAVSSVKLTIAGDGTITATGGASFGSINATPIGGTTPATGAFTGVTGSGDARFGAAGASLARLSVNPAASQIGVIVRANATTPGNLQEWQNSGGTALSLVSSTGAPTFGADVTLSGAPGKIKPAVNSTTAIQIAQADGTAFASWDTTNQRLGVRVTPTRTLGLGAGVSNQFMHLDDTGLYFTRTVDAGENAIIGRDAAQSTTNSVALRYLAARHGFLVGATEMMVLSTSAASVGSAGVLSIDEIASITAITTPSNAGLLMTNDQAAATADGQIFNRTNRATQTTDRYITTWKWNNVEVAHLANNGEFVTRGESALTNTVLNVLTVGHNTSGTPAASYGTGLLFQGESSTTSNRDMARIRSTWTTATDASRVANMVLSVWNIGVETDVLTLTPTVVFFASGVNVAIGGTNLNVPLTITGASAGNPNVLIANNTFLGWRNAAGSGNVNALTVDTNNDLTIQNANSAQFTILVRANTIRNRSSDMVIGADSANSLSLQTNSVNRLVISSAGLLTLWDGGDFALGTTTGTKIGTATSQKLSLWNATPDVQPTTAIVAAAFVANTSGIANDTATFGGYTIGQIVAALKRLGALA